MVGKRAESPAGDSAGTPGNLRKNLFLSDPKKIFQGKYRYFIQKSVDYIFDYIANGQII
jgi:hypothetical protein